MAELLGTHSYQLDPKGRISLPARFRAALQKTKQRLMAQPNGPRILNINCWNEWTEGSYLEPDVVNGMKYLEAVRDVFGAKP